MTGMGPVPISLLSIYQLCKELRFDSEDFAAPILRLDDLWLEWYRQEEENRRLIAENA